VSVGLAEWQNLRGKTPSTISSLTALRSPTQGILLDLLQTSSQMTMVIDPEIAQMMLSQDVYLRCSRDAEPNQLGNRLRAYRQRSPITMRLDVGHGLPKHKPMHKRAGGLRRPS
jgi:hypothetical protein